MRTQPKVGDEVLIRGTITRIEGDAMQIRLHGLGFPLMTTVDAELDHYGRTVLSAAQSKEQAA